MSDDGKEQTSSTSDATRTVARGSAINAIGNAIGVIEPGYFAVVSWILGPAALGLYVVATTWVALFARLATLGIEKGVLRHVPMARASDDREGALASVLGTALRYSGGASVLAMLVMMALSEQFAAADGQVAAGGATWIAVLALALPSEAVTQVLLFILRSVHDMVAFVVVRNIVLPGLLFVVGVPLMLLDVGRASLIVAYLCASYLSLGVAIVLFARRFRGLSASRLVRSPRDGALLSFSVPQGFTELMNFMLGRADILMIAMFLPHEPELVAFYTMASTIAATVKKARQAFDTSLAPMMADLIATGRTDELNALYQQVSRWVYLLYLLVAGVTTLLAPLLLRVFGEGFSEYWWLVPILVYGRLLNAMAGSSQVALLMSGRSRLELFNNASANVLNIVLNALLIPRYGVVGAAIATAVSLLLFNAVRAIQARMLLSLTPRASDVLRASLAGAVGLGAGLAVLLSFDARPTAAIPSAVVFVLVFVATAVAVGLREELRAGWQALSEQRRRRQARRAGA